MSPGSRVLDEQWNDYVVGGRRGVWGGGWFAKRGIPPSVDLFPLFLFSLFLSSSYSSSGRALCTSHLSPPPSIQPLDRREPWRSGAAPCRVLSSGGSRNVYRPPRRDRNGRVRRQVTDERRERSESGCASIDI